MSGSSLRKSSIARPVGTSVGTSTLTQSSTHSRKQSPCLPVCCTRSRAAAGALLPKTGQNDSSISITDLGGSSCVSAPQHQVRQQHLACTIVVHVLYGMAHTQNTGMGTHISKAETPTHLHTKQHENKNTSKQSRTHTLCMRPYQQQLSTA